MLFVSAMHDYLIWHYSRAFNEIFHVWLNFLWFVINFFSIPQLLRSWFAPWKRIVEDRGNKWKLEDLATYVVIGLLSRITGFIVRTIVILLGFFCLILTTIAGFIVYLFWASAPFSLVVMFTYGLFLII